MYNSQNDNLILNNNQMVSNQGMVNQGMTSQGMMSQGMMNQGMSSQDLMNQGMMNQGMMNQGMMNQGMMNQGMMNQGMMNQGMMNQGMMNQGMMNQGMMNQGMPQTTVPMQNNQMMMQQPVGGMQQMVPMGNGYDYGGIEANYCEDPLQILSNVNRAYIFQELEVWEQVTGCEQKNNYNVCVVDPITQMQYYLFRCKEDSSFCQRCCCSGASRAFSMRVKHIAADQAFGEGYNNYFAELLRPFKCTCCCFSRPEVSCYMKEGNVNLGTIKEPCTCCSPVLELYGPGELGKSNITLRYTVLIDCCQVSYMCSSCKCGKCQELECGIYDGKDTSMNRKLGRIIKKVTNEEFFSKANTFSIDFPENATPFDRLLIIFAGLFIDYRLFEDDVDAPSDEEKEDKEESGGCCDCDCDFGSSGGSSGTSTTRKTKAKTTTTKKSTSKSSTKKTAKKVDVKKAVKKGFKKLKK